MELTLVTNRVKESSPLDFGSIFSRSIELFKQVWIQGFIILLLTFVTIIPFYILIYIPMLVAGVTDPEMLRSEEFPAGLVIPMVILIPVMFLGISTMSLLLNAAFLRICRNRDLGLAVSDNYFHYFKMKFITKSILLSLCSFVLILLGMLACGIGVLYMIVPLSLFPAFLAFNEELSAMDILKSSFTLGNKNWLVIFGLIILMGLLAELGVLLCFIGVLFTAMMAKIPVYYIYKDGVGFLSGE